MSWAVSVCVQACGRLDIVSVGLCVPDCVSFYVHVPFCVSSCIRRFLSLFVCVCALISVVCVCADLL
jgi:hypothetical protein